MTISAVVPDIAFAGSSGSGTMGPFSLVKSGTPIVFYNNSEVYVYRYDAVTDTAPTLLVEGTDYTLTGGPIAGSITLTSPQTGLLTAERLYVYTRTSIAQGLDLVNGGNFSSSSLERRLDIIFQILQQLDREVRSGIRFAMFDADEIPKTLPLGAAIDKIPYVTGTASAPTVAYLDADVLADLSELSVENLANIATVAADLAGADTIGIVAAELEGDDNIGTVAGSIAEVNAIGQAIIANTFDPEGYATDAYNAQLAAEAAQAAAETAETNAELAELNAEAARDAAYLSKGVFESTAAALGNGVQGHGAITGGSGGTNGTFPLITSGGTQVVPVRGTFVVSGGAVTQINVYYPGYYTSNPTGFDFSASAGLTGASATPTIGVNVGVGEYFSVPATGDDSLILYRVTAGPAATEVTRYPATAAISGLRRADRDLRYEISSLDYSADSPPDFYVARSALEGSTNVKLATTADAGGNQVNADGTIRVGAGSYVEYPNSSVEAYDPDGYYYLYLVPVDPARAADLSVQFRQNDAATASAENTVDRSQFGVVKVTYRRRNTSSGLAFNQFFPRIMNNGATPVDIVWPRVSRTDDARIPDRMLASLGAAPRRYDQEIRTFEFWEQPEFFDLDLAQYLRDTTIAVDSVNGLDANAGTRFAPKQTLAGVGAAGSLTDGAVVAFRRGGVWREQLQSFFGANAWDAAFVADDRNNVGRMPMISAYRPISDSDITDNGNGTFTFAFVPNATSQPAMLAARDNSYNQIFVREVNVAEEAAGNRFAARQMLERRGALGDVTSANPARSFASYNAGTNTWTITFSPRTGVTPKDGTNTYEVIAQSGCISQGDGSTNGRNANYIGLHLDGAAAGYGVLSAGTGTMIDFCALTDSGTHLAVVASATVKRSLMSRRGALIGNNVTAFSASTNMEDTINVYDRNFIFGASGIYGHNSVGDSVLAEALVITNQYVQCDRNPLNNALYDGLGSADQCRRIIRRGNYVKNSLQDMDRFSTTFRPMVTSEFNFFDGIVRAQAMAGGSRENIYIGANWGDRSNAPANRGVFAVNASDGGSFENNLFVVTHEDGNFVPNTVSNFTADYSATVIRSDVVGNGIIPQSQSRVRRNIFVVHLPFAVVAPPAGVTILDAGTAAKFGNFDLDENIYVLLDCGVGPSITAPAQDLTAAPILIPPVNVGGTADSLTLTTGSALVANPGTIVFTTGAAANTGAVTVNVDGIGAVALKGSAGADLTAGQLAASTRYAARFISGEYRLLTFQSHLPGINVLRQKTGYEQNGMIIDARGHPLGLDAVFRDFARRDLRWANTDIARQIVQFNEDRVKNGLLPCGPSWTINRNVRQLTRDDAYRIISRRCLRV